MKVLGLTSDFLVGSDDNVLSTVISLTDEGARIDLSYLGGM